MTVFGGNCFDIVSENIVIVIKTWREGKITITMDLTIRNYIAVRPDPFITRFCNKASSNNYQKSAK